jgi:hypothetical protein
MLQKVRFLVPLPPSGEEDYELRAVTQDSRNGGAKKKKAVSATICVDCSRVGIGVVSTFLSSKSRGV